MDIDIIKINNKVGKKIDLYLKKYYEKDQLAPYLKEHVLDFINNCRYSNDDIRPLLTKLGYEVAGGKIDFSYVLPAMSAIHLFLLSFIPLDDIVDGIESPSYTSRELSSKIARAYSVATKLREDGGIIIRKNYGSFAFYEKINRIISQCLEKTNGSHTLETNVHNRKQISEYSFNDYLYLVDEATAIFMAESFVVGGLIAGADGKLEEAMRDFGIELGRLCQIRDDYLDYVDPQITGKYPFADLYGRRKRFPILAIYWFGNQNQKWKIESTLGKDSISDDDINDIIDMITDKKILEEVHKIISEISNRALQKMKLLSRTKSSYSILEELIFLLGQNW